MGINRLRIPLLCVITVVVGCTGVVDSGAPAGASTIGVLAGYEANALPPGTYGTLTTTFTIPSVTCSGRKNQGVNLVAEEAAGNWVASATVTNEGCSTLYPPEIQAFASLVVDNHKTWAEGVSVALGDQIRLTITDDVPNPTSGEGTLSASVTDVTTDQTGTVSKPRASPLGDFSLGATGAGGTAPFTRTYFPDSLFQGKPLASTPGGVTASNLENQNGKPLIVAGPLSSNGKRFAVTFKRAGIPR